jgi:hypothetical protein
MNKNAFGFMLIFILFGSGCASLSRQETYSQKASSDFQTIFEKVLKNARPAVSYQLESLEPKDGLQSYSAVFQVVGKKSFQSIVFTVNKRSTCELDSPPAQLTLASGGIGPGGSSFEISFCGNQVPLKLTDSNRLSNVDTGHGLDLRSLAESIQTELHSEQ